MSSHWLRFLSRNMGDTTVTMLSLGSLRNEVLRQDEELYRRPEFYKEVKLVVVLSVARTLGSPKNFTSYGDVITFSVFGFLSLKDKAVLLLGRKRRLYGQKMVKRQDGSKNNPLLHSVFINETCRKMNSDTKRSESVEVTRNKTARDGCSRKAWISERQEGDSYLKSYELLKLIISESFVGKQPRETTQLGNCKFEQLGEVQGRFLHACKLK